MDKHVKVVGWLWIGWGVVSILMGIIGLIIVNLNIPGQKDAVLVTGGSVCFLIPGIVANFVAGFGLLKYKAWARILAIILGVITLIVFPIGTAVGVYTLVIMFNKETVALLKGGGASTTETEVVS